MSTISTHRPQAVPLAVSEPEAARLLGVSPRTLWGWRKARKAPHHRKVDGRILYPLAALQTWLMEPPKGAPHDEA